MVQHARFNHSMNYRSVVILGTQRSSAIPKRSGRAARFQQHTSPGAGPFTQPNEKELATPVPRPGSKSLRQDPRRPAD
jgi:nitroimidazol reductase NimA-like FMN-containing flavoprotein (pyridoxamine 5'-phosphate oxidase superfamily)